MCKSKPRRIYFIIIKPKVWPHLKYNYGKSIIFSKINICPECVLAARASNGRRVGVS